MLEFSGESLIRCEIDCRPIRRRFCKKSERLGKPSLSLTVPPSSPWLNGASKTYVSTFLGMCLQEMQELKEEPPCQCSVGPDGDDIFKWNGSITGPPGTPYAGGVFCMSILFPKEYPFKPPTVRQKQHTKYFADQIYDAHFSSEYLGRRQNLH